MKVIVTKKAYYNNTIVVAGTILDFKGKKLPSWAEEIATSQAPRNDKKNDKDDEKFFDELLTKAIEKNIDVDLEKKSIKEKIAILERALKENK